MTGTVNITMDLSSLGADLDYPLDQALRDEVAAIVREEMRKILKEKTKRELRKWINKEFLGKGELMIKDGMVTIPLMLPVEDLRHG